MGRGRKRTSVGSVVYNISGSSEDVTKQLGDWSTYPSGAQRMFEEGTNTLASVLDENDQMQTYFRDVLRLDPTNPEHVEVGAALMALTSAYNLTFDEDEGAIESSGDDSSANVRLFPAEDGTIGVDLNTFAKLGRSRQSNLAYSMIRRMVWGIRRYAEIHDMPPSGTIYLQAESDGMAMNGVQTWAKLGFNFNMRAVEDAAQEMGFTGKTSQEVMLERNAAGQSGFDAWNEIVQRTIDSEGGAEADGGFDVSDGSTSIMLLNAYAARRGL